MQEQTRKHNFYVKYIKRLFDLLICILSIPLLVLMILPVGVIIRLEDGGSVFYCSKRLGKNGVPFKMFKFRTMIIDAPDIRVADGSTYNAKDDPRLTRFGRFLRETSMDEIPQIFNVLLGHMSIIGPRPDITYNKEFYNEVVYNLQVRPGISGYSQAFYRSDCTWAEKIRHNRYYVDNISLLLDLKILIKTIVTVLGRKSIYKENFPGS